MALGGFLNQLSPLLVSRGLSVASAASFMSLFVLMVVIGRIAVGALLDAFRAPLVCFLVMTFAAAGASLLLTEAPSPLFCTLVVVTLGAAMGAEGDVQAFLIARHFGLAHFATLFGSSAMCTSAGLGLGASIFGGLYDSTGDYRLAILIAMALLVFAGLCFGSIGNEARSPQPAAGQ
jgi:predicted MFS family arabinose efflux permease